MQSGVGTPSPLPPSKGPACTESEVPSVASASAQHHIGLSAGKDISYKMASIYSSRTRHKKI